jgi:ribonuclease P protein component
MTGLAVGRIRDRSTFRALGRPEGRAARGPIQVSFVSAPSPAEPPFPQVGYAVSRQHGNAVHRNRLRRRLRAAVRQAANQVPVGSYLIRPAPATAILTFDELVAAVGQAMATAAGRRMIERGR